MSFAEKTTAAARRLRERSVHYGREFAALAIYAVACAAVCLPTVVATGGVIFWGSSQLGLEGAARTVYFAAGVLAIMLVFNVLHRFVQQLHRKLFGATRSPMWQI
ncbi:hypothetical protein M0R88_11760 [Halorussus gelatinilyticus]|uniref:Uncharacterized protein n=1 Tax=Halorussus gelatinilyticus TaxID=2937524 RepID=A0A8U0IEU2_9EURY|nr:hypothetical protein [Halorussus gelatinilyticus]UPV99200.1 hypothetical protein M0R88_11760 [Halorussus gelatinilyticus]